MFVVHTFHRRIIDYLFIYVFNSFEMNSVYVIMTNRFSRMTALPQVTELTCYIIMYCKKSHKYDFIHNYINDINMI